MIRDVKKQKREHSTWLVRFRSLCKRGFDTRKVTLIQTFDLRKIFDQLVS